MLSTLISTALLLGCVAGSDAPSKEQIATWVEGLAGTEDAQSARLLTAAWPQARLAVSTALAGHEAPSVRSWCARILGDHAGDAEQAALQRAALRDGLPRVRAVALQQMAKRPDPRYLETLASAIEWESDRGNVVTLLGLVERSGELSLAERLIGAIEARWDGNQDKAAYASLRKLTRANLPDEPGPWKAWLDGRKGAGEVTEDEGDGDGDGDSGASTDPGGGR